MPIKKYPSRFGAKGPITFAQMVAETVLARQAKLRGKVLPQRFWQLPEHRRWFALQVMWCNSLLARIEDEAVAESVLGAVLRSPEGLVICTMRNPQLIPLMEAEVRKRTTQKAIAETRPEPVREQTGNSPVSRPPQARPKNLFDSLS